MRKKIISLICVLVMLIPNASVSAGTEQNTATETAEALKALNLLTDEKKITHDSFVYSLAGFLYDNPESVGTPQELAAAMGMVDSTDEFKGTQIITVDEALKYAVVALGYKPRAIMSGASNYRGIAAELGIIDGVKAGGAEILLFEDAVKILYNMLEIPPMVSYHKSEAERGYMIETGETLLSLNRGIHEISGMLTANDVTSIYREDGAAPDCVRIGETEYSVSDTCNTDLLGRNVIAYIKDGSYGEASVVYIGEKENKNKVLKIEADNIESVAEDFSVITYSEGARYLKAKLTAVPRIIYNGVYFDEYTIQDLMPDVGNITLVDNNNDNKYDIVEVTSYQTVVVESIDSIDRVIYNKYKFESIKLDEESADYIIYSSDGEQTEFMNLKMGDVLSVKSSRNAGVKQIKIYISGKEKVTDKINLINREEMKLKVGESEYKMTSEFYNYMNNSGNSLVLGGEYVFRFDIFGNIVYAETVQDREYNLFYKMYEEDENIYVIYMDINNVWNTSPLAKKVKNNGSQYSSSKLFELYGGISPQVVKLRENSDGEVISFEIAEVMGYTEGRFTKTAETSYQYLLNPNSFAMKLYLEDDAKLFVLPEDATNKDDYYVRSASGFFTADKTYKITAYDQDEYGFCPVFTIVYSDANKMERVNQGMFVITSIFQKQVDGDVVSVIKGNFGQYKNLTLVGNTADIYDGIEPGDVVNVGMNAKGRVNYVKKIMSLDAFEPSDPLSYYKNSLTLAGTIEAIDIEKKRFKINCGSMVSFRFPVDSSIQIYTQKDRTCEMKNAAELHVGDRVVCRLTYGKVAEIVCVR